MLLLFMWTSVYISIKTVSSFSLRWNQMDQYCNWKYQPSKYGKKKKMWNFIKIVKITHIFLHWVCEWNTPNDWSQKAILFKSCQIVNTLLCTFLWIFSPTNTMISTKMTFCHHFVHKEHNWNETTGFYVIEDCGIYVHEAGL